MPEILPVEKSSHFEFARTVEHTDALRVEEVATDFGGMILSSEFSINTDLVPPNQNQIGEMILDPRNGWLPESFVEVSLDDNPGALIDLKIFSDGGLQKTQDEMKIVYANQMSRNSKFWWNNPGKSEVGAIT